MGARRKDGRPTARRPIAKGRVEPHPSSHDAHAHAPLLRALSDCPRAPSSPSPPSRPPSVRRLSASVHMKHVSGAQSRQAPSTAATKQPLQRVRAGVLGKSRGMESYPRQRTRRARHSHVRHGFTPPDSETGTDRRPSKPSPNLNHALVDTRERHVRLFWCCAQLCVRTETERQLVLEGWDGEQMDAGAEQEQEARGGKPSEVDRRSARSTAPDDHPSSRTKERLTKGRRMRKEARVYGCPPNKEERKGIEIEMNLNGNAITHRLHLALRHARVDE